MLLASPLEGALEAVERRARAHLKRYTMPQSK